MPVIPVIRFAEGTWKWFKVEAQNVRGSTLLQNNLNEYGYVYCVSSVECGHCVERAASVGSNASMQKPKQEGYGA